jgi:hypothetical protein
MADEAWRRTIACEDAGGRERALTVMVTDKGKLLIATPPGEFAVITLAAGNQLKNAITAAQFEASGRGGQP